MISMLQYIVAYIQSIEPSHVLFVMAAATAFGLACTVQ